jgi:hypothetical protein
MLSVLRHAVQHEDISRFWCVRTLITDVSFGKNVRTIKQSLIPPAGAVLNVSLMFLAIFCPDDFLKQGTIEVFRCMSTGYLQMIAF